MKVGDLVTMPRESLAAGAWTSEMDVGIIVEDTDRMTWPGRRERIGVLWADGGGVVDYEPKDWLDVVSSCKEEEVMV